LDDERVLPYAIKPGKYVKISITDTGMGMDEKTRERIFDPFFSTKGMGRGTGLGLAVVWGTVKDHRGYIDVWSEEGKGTTFTIYFPVTRKELSGKQSSVPASEYIGRGENLLVIDDVPSQRELANAILSMLNYRVTFASSGEEAVDYLTVHHADLIILDMIMDPGIDGLETYKRILKINPHQKAIIVSGFSETDRVKEAQELGAGAYVKKPYIREKIGLAIRKELDKPIGG
jgi:CheY-like chemotaxis protein